MEESIISETNYPFETEEDAASLIWFSSSYTFFECFTMQRVSRIIALAAPKLLAYPSFTCTVSKQSFTTSSVRPNFQNLQERAIPGDFLKWGSLGFIRNSRFATGFAPLQPKPLDSIMDFERAKVRSPEDLASIWDDVMLNSLLYPFARTINPWFLIFEMGFWHYALVKLFISF